jgi:phospholipid/cholesterol/gamma-HCH transport system substrate-binding protein
MITRSVRVKVGVFLVVTLLGVVYLGIRYVKLGEQVTGRRYAVFAEFDTGGGIFTNASVTYRGYPVGEVGDVRLFGSGARVELRIDRRVRIPSEVRAVVTLRSAVGEQYVDLRPDRNTGRYLRAGDLIPRERTGGPLPLETLLVNFDQLITSINADDLAVVIAELGKAVAGNELALRKLLDASSVLINEAARFQPETLTLIRDGRTALATQAASASAIQEWARGLAQLASALRAGDGDLRRVLVALPPAASQLVGLLQDLEPAVGTLLGNLVTAGDILFRNIDGVRQMLVVYPSVIETGFTVTGADGTLQVGWVPDPAGPRPCQAGQPCTGVRGAASAPRPTGTGSGARTTNAGLATPVVDPRTGMVTTADGLPLIFGDTGGQSRLAGAQSWKTLLLSGVAS